MHLTYEKRNEKFMIVEKSLQHEPPHLHNEMEFIYVTEGELELGMGCELYHMEKGDFAIIFPDVIHHYQVFTKGENKACCVYASPELGGPFLLKLQKCCPKEPVIPKECLHNDIKNAVIGFLEEPNLNDVVAQAYVQIILSRSLNSYEMVDKDSIGNQDIIYLTMSYMLLHFKEELTLAKVAKEIGVNKYALSRVFSCTFHTNFNQYLNDIRLDHASFLLGNSELRVTEICMEVGFESQRTFNRAFKQRYNMTPREYRRFQVEKQGA